MLFEKLYTFVLEKKTKIGLVENNFKISLKMNKSIYKNFKIHSSMTISINQVETHPWHISIIFEQNLVSSFGEEDENIIVDGGMMPMTDRTTDNDPSYKFSLLYTTAELTFMVFFSKYCSLNNALYIVYLILPKNH